MAAGIYDFQQGPLDLGTTLGDGTNLGKRQARLFEFTGDHYEMGYQQGLQLREAIGHFFANLRASEVFRAQKPLFLPMRAFLNLTARRAMGEMREDVTGCCERQKTRMEGIAKGAGIDESMLFLALYGEMIMPQVNYRLGACTAAAVSEEKSAIGEPMVIKNFDYPEFYQPYYITRLCLPVEGIPTLDVTMAPLAGCHDGINQLGLCVSCNHGYGTDIPNTNVPVNLLVQQVLENCGSTREALDYLAERKRSGGAIILVADASGDMATIELSSNFGGVREPEEGILINTNHYRCREMKSYDIPRNAYYTARNAKPLRGIRVHESSELRYSRAEQLLSGREEIAIKDLLNVFSDHGESGRGDDNTICRHGQYLTTTCSLIMLPRSRRLLVTYGHPCDSVFTDFLNPFRREEEQEEAGAQERGESPSEQSEGAQETKGQPEIA